MKKNIDIKNKSRQIPIRNNEGEKSAEQLLYEISQNFKRNEGWFQSFFKKV